MLVTLVKDLPHLGESLVVKMALEKCLYFVKLIGLVKNLLHLG